MPDPIFPPMLTTSGRRARAAAMIRAAAVATDAPELVADALDTVSGLVLAIVGVDPEAGRAILAALWGDQR